MDTPVPAPYREGLPPQPPGPPEGEQHVRVPEAVRDLIAGVLAGMVLPFALAAALAMGGVAAGPILSLGVAAAAAGGIAHGLGLYFSRRAEARHYAAERAREEQETHDYPEREKWEVAALLHRYGLRGETLQRATEAIAADRRRWVDFMMRFELDLQEPLPGHAAAAASRVGLAHGLAGLVPLLPYALLAATGEALLASALLTGAALLGLGYLQARSTGTPPLRGALERVAIGAAAAAAAGLAVLLAG
jgi:VIT1/CCC1 family predicted Fe2+/Mn2+ transporter